MKTVEEIIGLAVKSVERSQMGLEIARVKADQELFALNLRRGFEAYLRQGLVGWRCGILSPVGPFREGLNYVHQGQSTWQTMKGGTTPQPLQLPLEKALFVAFLVNESPIAFDLNDFLADRLLDAVVGIGLIGNWNELFWNSGLEQLRQLKGSSLAVESYMTYHRLLHSSQDSEANAIVEKATSLFEKRKSNGFFSGGEQTEGGGNDNKFTVDYRLAAIMKRIGFNGVSIHSWRWE